MRDTNGTSNEKPASSDLAGLVCLGVIVGAHGVKGAVRVKSFTADPKDLTAYGPLRDAPAARRFEMTVTAELARVVIAEIEGIDDREAAQALKGLRLYVPRGALPEPEEGEYYHADLVGLRAEGTDGSLIGTVRAVHDFGAGDMIEVEREEGGETILLPFTEEMVPLVDTQRGRIVVKRP